MPSHESSPLDVPRAKAAAEGVFEPSAERARGETSGDRLDAAEDRRQQAEGAGDRDEGLHPGAGAPAPLPAARHREADDEGSRDRGEPEGFPPGPPTVVCRWHQGRRRHPEAVRRLAERQQGDEAAARRQQQDDPDGQRQAAGAGQRHQVRQRAERPVGGAERRQRGDQKQSGQRHAREHQIAEQAEGESDDDRHRRADADVLDGRCNREDGVGSRGPWAGRCPRQSGDGGVLGQVRERRDRRQPGGGTQPVYGCVDRQSAARQGHHQAAEQGGVEEGEDDIQGDLDEGIAVRPALALVDGRTGEEIAHGLGFRRHASVERTEALDRRCVDPLRGEGEADGDGDERGEGQGRQAPRRGEATEDGPRGVEDARGGHGVARQTRRGLARVGVARPRIYRGPGPQRMQPRASPRRPTPRERSCR